MRQQTHCMPCCGQSSDIRISRWYRGLIIRIFSFIRRRQRRMKSAASIQKCCGLAVFICVTNWWLDEWIIIKIIYSMAPSQEGMMRRELQSRLTSLAEVAGVRGHFGTCAATSENCQTIQYRGASTQVVLRSQPKWTQMASNHMYSTSYGHAAISLVCFMINPTPKLGHIPSLL